MNNLELTLHILKWDADWFISENAEDIPLILEVLIAAEDRRAVRHRGIDWFSIGRAVYRAFWSGRIRGLSTIEQQYVRTVHRRKGSLILCKLRELWLARRLCSKVTKREIWAAYLWRAYYGARMNGYTAARKHFCGNAPLTLEGAARIVACLKYPRPLHNVARWEARHAERVRHILTIVRTGA